MPVFSGRDRQLDVRIPRIDADVLIDGDLTDPVWPHAAVLTGFSQYSPNDGVPAADSTQVLVWYSPNAIYFGIRAFESHGRPTMTLANRDQIFGDDNVQILLGTFHDAKQAWMFAVNPFGMHRGLVVDLNPEATGKASGAPTATGYRYDTGNPQIGGNVRWGVSDNLTVNGTIKPDFSQVESDVGQLAFDPRQALYFPEKRPFFLEGSELFRVPQNLIYTRRVVQPVAAVKLTGARFVTGNRLVCALCQKVRAGVGHGHTLFISSPAP